MTTELENIDRRIQQMTALNYLVMEISKIRDLDSLFWHVAENVPRLIDAEDCSVLLIDPETDVLTFRTAKTRNIGVVVPRDTVSILMSVFKSKTPRRTADATQEPDYNFEIAEQAGIHPKTLVAAPIILDDQAIGVVEVINKKQGGFTEFDEEVVKTIATHIAASVENGWLYESSQRRLNELSILVEINRAISTSYDLETLFENISKTLIETTQLQEFSVSSWDRENDQIVIMVDCIQKDITQLIKRRGKRYSLKDYPLTKKVLENREIITMNTRDPGANLNEVRLLAKRKKTIIMMVPMVVRNNVTGLFEIYFSVNHSKGLQNANLYQAIANQIGAAIENTRLHEESRKQASILEKRVQDRTKELEALAEAERKQRELAETLREAGAIVASTLDPGSAINEILNQLARVVPYDSASVQLLNENELVIVAGGGWIEYKQLQGYRFRIPGPNPNTIVLNQLRPVILNYEDLIKHEEFQKATHGAIRSWLGVPLITQDMVIGMLTLDSTQNGYFKDEHASLASAFADQVAVALEQAILFQKTQAALTERDALRAIMVEITGELELPQLLNTVMTKACELLNTMSAEIGLYHPDREVIEIVALYNQEVDFIGKIIPVGKGLVGQAALKKAPLLIEDYSTWEHALPEYKDSVWYASMAAPLTYHQRLIGVMVVGDKRPSKTFTQSDLELLTMLAHQVAIAIENAQLFQKVQVLATIDDLTGLLNRRELFRIGTELFEISIEEDIPLSAVMFDIDLFKLINDTYGHSTGDQVLQELAEVCLEQIRTHDILCRYGGEEFTLLLPGADFETARQISDRIRQHVEQTPLKTDRGDLMITLSFGVATLEQRHASLAALIDDADAAMYLAKNLGRNRVAGYIKAKG